MYFIWYSGIGRIFVGKLIFIDCEKTQINFSLRYRLKNEGIFDLVLTITYL